MTEFKKTELRALAGAKVVNSTTELFDRFFKHAPSQLLAKILGMDEDKLSAAMENWLKLREIITKDNYLHTLREIHKVYPEWETSAEVAELLRRECLERDVYETVYNDSQLLLLNNPLSRRCINLGLVEAHYLTSNIRIDPSFWRHELLSPEDKTSDLYHIEYPITSCHGVRPSDYNISLKTSLFVALGECPDPFEGLDDESKLNKVILGEILRFLDVLLTRIPRTAMLCNILQK